MRVIIIEPNVPEYPDAKFPGVVVFSEIYQVQIPSFIYLPSSAPRSLVLYLTC